jgi:hypothetical protein
VTPIAETQPSILSCRCTGCGAPHHLTGGVAVARWYLDLPRRPREEVCGTCANRRTPGVTRRRYLTPLPGWGSRRWRLAGKVVAGLEITAVSAQEGVVCECYDPQCACDGRCTSGALYLWGGVEHEDWQYLCRACCLRLVERGGPATGEEERRC